MEETVSLVLPARLSSDVLVSHRQLRRLRQTRALSQEELADKAGVARSTVLKLERPGANARPSTIRKLARALGVKTEDLVVVEPA